jgi:hypothetical protein
MVETSPPPDGAPPVALPEESKREPRRLRSARWYDSPDMRGFAHSQRTQQMGLRQEEFPEELLRSHPIDGAVLLGGCDQSVPGFLIGAISGCDFDFLTGQAPVPEPPIY